MNKEQTRQEYQERIAPVAADAGCDLVVLFGSTATGKTHAQSDIDLAVRLLHRMRPQEIAVLATRFADALGTGKIDLVDLRAAPPALLRAVAHNGALLYERTPHLYSEFCAYAFMRYMEAQPLYALQRAEIDRFVAAQHV